MRRFTVPTVLLLLFAAAASAEGQNTTTTDTALRVAGPPPRPSTDSLFRRARRLVAEGNGVSGRALVDSLMHAADPSTPAYGDALYWHGALAATAAEAERDYRRVIVEYPLAYYADDALLAIAELEQARGDRAGALMHLQRFVKEHPSSPGRGVAALGAARLAFEQRDTTVGCSMIAVARTSASVADVELRNQIDYYSRQCSGATTVASVPPVSVPPVSAPRASAPRASVPPASEPAVVAAPRTPPPRVSASASTMPEPATPAPRPTSSSTPPPRETASARPVPPRPVPVRPVPVRPVPARPSTMYTIQLAAYDTRPPAEQLVRKLATRGVKARVSGTARPFRVRLDFYRTRQDAVNAAAALKARGIIGFVAQEIPPVDARSP